MTPAGAASVARGPCVILPLQKAKGFLANAQVLALKSYQKGMELNNSDSRLVWPENISCCFCCWWWWWW